MFARLNIVTNQALVAAIAVFVHLNCMNNTLDHVMAVIFNRMSEAV